MKVELCYEDCFYEGDCFDGLPHGRGGLYECVEWNELNENERYRWIYRGQFENGRPSGRGEARFVVEVFEDADSAIRDEILYRGSFKKGVPDGEGELNFADSTAAGLPFDKIKGNFCNGHLELITQLKTSNCTFLGNFRNTGTPAISRKYGFDLFSKIKGYGKIVYTLYGGEDKSGEEIKSYLVFIGYIFFGLPTLDGNYIKVEISNDSSNKKHLDDFGLRSYERVFIYDDGNVYRYHGAFKDGLPCNMNNTSNLRITEDQAKKILEELNWSALSGGDAYARHIMILIQSMSAESDQ